MSKLEKLRISSNTHRLYITKKEALKIELNINVLEDKNYWRELGDKLYNFHAQDIFSEVEIPEKQFNFIKACLSTA
jgi:hypothetical protein